MSNPFDILYATHSQQRHEGVAQGYMQGSRLFWSHSTIGYQPIIKLPAITLVGQGGLDLRLGNEGYSATPNQLLVNVLPIACDARHHLGPEGRFIGLHLPLDLALIRELGEGIFTHQPERQPSKGSHFAAVTAFSIGAGMADALQRLLTTLLSPMDSMAMGSALSRELHYRLMMSGQGAALLAFAGNRTINARLAHSIEPLFDQFNQSLSIEDMAAWAQMSGSAYHRAFKQILGDSPLQYQKKLRLDKARELLRADDIKAGDAARAVGYESLSQFSREFKRHFGYPPSQHR